ncbi:MAG: antitoxin family protein [Bdellovibrionota bacterium]
MSRSVKAIYENGVLKPQEPLQLAEHAETYVVLEEQGFRKNIETKEYEGPLPRKFRSSGSGASGRSDISERFEELLTGGFGKSSE